MKSAAIFLCTAIAIASAAQAPQPPAPGFRLYFLGRDIGLETDTWSADGRRLEATFHFDDRGTAIDLAGTLELAGGEPTRLAVKGRNYRLFTSDSEVTVSNGVAHIRDLAAESDISIAGRPFFPIDNYAPIGVQEQLIQYWRSHGRPTEIVAPPAGTVRIESRGLVSSDPLPGEPRPAPLERVAISGVVWGTETAWFEPESGRLVALVT